MNLKGILIASLIIILLGLGCSTSEAATESAPAVAPANGAVDVEEFIKNAMSGKYSKNDRLSVSAVYGGVMVGDKNGMFVIFPFGPEVDGIILFAKVNITNAIELKKFETLKIGQRAIVEGLYGDIEDHFGFWERTKHTKKRGVALRYAQLKE